MQDVYVPVLRALGALIEVTLCADVSRERAGIVAAALGATALAGGVDELLAARGATDGILIAHPNTLHASAASACLIAGRHVFCEKPVATSTAECELIENALSRGGTALTVNQFRRAHPAGAGIRRVIQLGWLGRPVAVRMVEGGFGGWNSRSGFQFDARAAGGGVTLDRGAHVFDQLIWWLGVPQLADYRDDAHGGCEANSLTRVRWPDGFEGTVSLSKTEAWPSRFGIDGERGSLVWTWGEPIRIAIDLDRSDARAFETALYADGAVRDFDLETGLSAMLTGWLRAANGDGPNPASISDVRPSIALIESCYRQRRPLDLSWDAFAGE